MPPERELPNPAKEGDISDICACSASFRSQNTWHKKQLRLAEWLVSLLLLSGELAVLQGPMFDGLLMAVNHVWACLDKPRGFRCALITQKVGRTGTGRRALLRFLSRFLEETLHEFQIPDLPERSAYTSFEDWNAARLAHFERVEMRLTAITARYEAILDGREPDDVLPAPTGKVIKGPWARSGA